MLSFLDVYSDHSILEFYNLFSGVELSMRSFFVTLYLFAAKIARSGHMFLCRLIDLSTSVTKLHHHITLNLEARKDIRWWSDFLPTWNGISIIPEKDWSYQADLEIFTDAVSTSGYGAYYHGKWFHGPWPTELPDDSIQWKELFPIYAACRLWGPQ